jgi:hypothetical protein
MDKVQKPSNSTSKDFVSYAAIMYSALRGQQPSFICYILLHYCLSTEAEWWK